MMPTDFRDQHRQLSRPDLVVLIGYGDELPVYLRARAVWEFYASHVPGIEIIFLRDCPDLRDGEIRHDGRDLLVGTGIGKIDEAGYAATGRWSASENQRQIRKQAVFYDYLLRARPEPFWLYQASVTSAIDFRGLLEILPLMPATGCYGGMAGRLSGPPELAGLVLCSGANNLFSRDVIALLRERYQPGQAANQLPNDVWQALTLPDIPRTPLPQFSFTRGRSPAGLDDVPARVQSLLAQGHFHFRIKTESEAAGLGRREDVDPWLMLRIMETLLGTPYPAGAARHLLGRLARFCNAGPDGRLPPASALPIYDEAARDFPINESDLPE